MKYYYPLLLVEEPLAVGGYWECKSLVSLGMWTGHLPCPRVHCDWFNKEADWPIAKQDKVRQENQTKRILGRRMESEEMVGDTD